MGILERLGVRQRKVSSTSINLGIASPWQEGSLTQIVLSDLLGADVVENMPLGRADAMTVPAVAKARNLLVSTVAQFPLRAQDEKGSDIKTQPTWLYRTEGPVSPQERMVYTIDDGFFYGLSLWLVDRGEPDRSGRRPILNAEYCPWSQWEVKDGKILVNDNPVDESEIILFNFWNDGILIDGRRTIRSALDLEKSIAGKVRNPVPIMELRITDDANLSQTEAAEYVKTWAAARRNVDGAVSITPPGMQLVVHGEISPELFVDGRNAVRTDVGSFANTRASMLDGTAGVDSLTYSTTQGERNLYYEVDVPFWTGPIEARLSQPDVTPRGQQIRFAKYDTEAPSPPPSEAITPTPDGIPPEEKP